MENLFKFCIENKELIEKFCIENKELIDKYNDNFLTKYREEENKKLKTEERRIYKHTNEYKYTMIQKKILSQHNSSIKRRMRKLNNGGEFKLTLEEKNVILLKQNGKCLDCGKQFNKIRIPTEDHIIPLSKGGWHVAENIQFICKSCNSKKLAKIDDENILTWCNKHMIKEQP
jgi:5-methylcytosine-specific restriction endonuclease McrA